ncbi:PREDICTED: putative claudin-25 [Gekko japonicus]|uniref:Claudin n=1 Tax=Gekko japonicus TaxID=146911 RepID=A0ABM1KVT5_GEKJA|nr:PREDICTED: putative claudin-25 [Gekko japonicus]
MAWPPSSRAQLGGMLLAFFGWVSSCVTTIVPFWKNLNMDLNVLEVWNMGLWHACVIQEEGATECKAYDSLLALPIVFRLARILMIAANGLGFLAFFLSLWGMNCLKTSDKNTELKRQLGVAGGILFCLSGIVTLVPVSWVAYNTVQEFWDETVPEIVPRWEFGDALFLGWFAGFFLLVGGLLFICSTCRQETQEPSHVLPTYPRREAPNQPRLPDRHQYTATKNADLVI